MLIGISGYETNASTVKLTMRDEMNSFDAMKATMQANELDAC